MYRSIQKLASLPDETVLLPGHNYSEVASATLAELKKTNVHMRIKDIESWKMMMGD
jgi:glyoxylase-like metal-dependent hydrolase (beta-lactamase superfamily II)